MIRRITLAAILALWGMGVLTGCTAHDRAAKKKREPSPHGASAGDAIAVTHAGAQKPIKGAKDQFTGEAVIQMLFVDDDVRKASAATVTFEPGARTAWHSHPAGQTLIVTSGTGWVRKWGEAAQKMKAGDVVWIAPGTKHWHGATSTDAVTHIAFQQQLDGKVVTWQEPVADDQYGDVEPRNNNEEENH